MFGWTDSDKGNVQVDPLDGDERNRVRNSLLLLVSSTTYNGKQ